VGLTIYDQMAIDLLVRAKTVGKEIHILVAQLANEYCIDQRFVEQKLTELHNDKIIRLSAYHETGVVKPLEDWPSPECFFAYASDGNYKRVLLLLKGAELLERLSPDEPDQRKQAIGFHA